MERQNGISILDDKGIIYDYKESEPEEALYLQEDTVEYKYDYEEEKKQVKVIPKNMINYLEIH